MADETPKFIVKSFREARCHKMLVQWDGYDDPKDFTWEPKRNLKEDLGISYFHFVRMMNEEKKGESKDNKA